MSRRLWVPRLVATVATLSMAIPVGCTTAEVRAPVPGATDDMGRAVSPLAPDHGWSWTLDAGSIPGPLSGPTAPLASGLRLAIRADSGLSGSAAAYSVEEYRPSPIPVGTVRWVTGAAGPDGGVSGDVLVEWMIGLRERGSCAVDVDLVPRLTPSCGGSVFLESLRVHRRLTVGDSLVLTTGPVGESGTVAPLLVGAPAGGAGRFVIRVRK